VRSAIRFPQPPALIFFGRRRSVSPAEAAARIDFSQTVRLAAHRSDLGRCRSRSTAAGLFSLSSCSESAGPGSGFASVLWLCVRFLFLRIGAVRFCPACFSFSWISRLLFACCSRGLVLLRNGVAGLNKCYCVVFFQSIEWVCCSDSCLSLLTASGSFVLCFVLVEVIIGG
jgi:hypothetical protein